MSELLGRSNEGEDYPWTWGVSEDQLRLFEQYLHARYEPGITPEDLSEGELDLVERVYLAPSPEASSEKPVPPRAIPKSTVSVEELEALFALPEIDEPEIEPQS